MATIRKIMELNIPADTAWDALADFHNVHVRLAPGFLTASQPDGDDVRVVSFANGTTAREKLVAKDAALRRLAYTIASERMTHHHASAEIVADGPARCRFVWTTDVLPDALAPYIDGQMEAGAQAMKVALDR
jgi:polyketide cyclase/dehydrase/lipid transport protein